MLSLTSLGLRYLWNVLFSVINHWKRSDCRCIIPIEPQDWGGDSGVEITGDVEKNRLILVISYLKRYSFPLRGKL